MTSAWYDAVDPANTYGDCHRQDHFNYDALGNRRSWDHVASRGWMNFTRKDNGLNQYRAWWNYSIINYDEDIGPPWGSPAAANGVLMQDGWITAGFNAVNQPMYIWSANVGWTNFGYDPLGRCVKRANDTGAISYLYYDGWNLIQEGPSASTPDRIYIHGARIDQILCSYQYYTGAAFNFYYDAPGHCTLATNSYTGNIVEQYDYDAFGKPYFYDGSGNPLPNGSGIGTRFLFTGREWLSELKLYDYRNRLYQPELGRFLQPDPKQFAAGDYNLYRYCHNDPVNRSDPDGLYGRGDGFSDDQWKRFDRAQQDAASKIEKAAAKMDTKIFEKVFGKGSATRENLSRVSHTMQKMAAALRDDGSKGYIANATHAWAIHARGMNENTMGHTKVNGTMIRINVDHPLYGNNFRLGWTAGHESGHDAGLRDEAYKHQTELYRGLTPAQALRNADSYMDFANP
jgi:RHS repeat-associated protein